MAVVRRTHTSYGQNVTNSVKGIMTGICLFFGATALLWWNEGRAVKTTAMLKEAESVTVEMTTPEKIDPALNGKMVHGTAHTFTPDTLYDVRYGITANVLKCKRRVEYYQWEEDEHTETFDDGNGGKETVTTYTYSKSWVSEPINSSSFEEPAGHQNIAPFREKEAYLTAPTIIFGAYKLPDVLIGQINNYTPLIPPPSPEQQQLLQEQAREAYQKYYKTSGRFMAQHGNVVYYGSTSPSNPEIGDVRVTFLQVAPGDFSLHAVAADSTFKEYVAKNDYTLAVIKPGKISSEMMYKQEHTDNAILTWVLRFLDMMGVIFGIKLTFSLFYTVLKIIPFVGNAVETGIGLVAAVLGFGWSMIVIGTAWVFFRPLLGIGMFAVVVLVFILMSTVGFKKKELNASDELPAYGDGTLPPPAPEPPAVPAAPAAAPMAGAYQQARRAAAQMAPPPVPDIPAQPAAPQQPAAAVPPPIEPDTADAVPPPLPQE